MKIAELLTLMGHLSVGNDNITPTERAIFLQYLNLAHLELYQETANFNQDLLIKEDLETEQDSNTVTLSRTPYLISTVYDRVYKRYLARHSVTDDRGHDMDMMDTGTPVGYTAHRGRLSFLPPIIKNVRVTVWYVPQPSALTEATDEWDIPYPVAYHTILADGSLYYLFQEEGGFKNTQKELEAKKRWETGKSRLLSYLHSSSGQAFSTFSSI